MLYIEAPRELAPVIDPRPKSLFLAGGITGCPDWQSEMVEMLGMVENLILFNPRRKDFPMSDPDAAEAQIEWEHTYLRIADAVLFWFPPETLCPIVLYELGAMSMTQQPLFIGVHPDYARRQDVIIQTSLARPDVYIVDNLTTLTSQVKRYWGVE